ncbi:MAG: hypothetical protein JSV52_10075 [Candidatus Zixiibacteriota bacterium]|nr:MAG: hypothetical protein JSV52_10075 [candidate division Zixibacteria bacterium]
MEEQTRNIKEISLPIYQAKVWMQLLGVVMIINGIIIAITIIGILVAWLPIWLGVLLFQAASSAESAQVTGNKHQLLESLRKLKTYFVINGVLMLITLIFIGFSILIAGAGLFSMMGMH